MRCYTSCESTMERKTKGKNIVGGLIYNAYEQKTEKHIPKLIYTTL